MTGWERGCCILRAASSRSCGQREWMLCAASLRATAKTCHRGETYAAWDIHPGEGSAWGETCQDAARIILRGLLAPTALERVRKRVTEMEVRCRNRWSPPGCGELDADAYEHVLEILDEEVGP